MTSPIAPLCMWCRHKGKGLACAAFPHGIPTEIVHSSVIHTAPFPGDRDIRFEPIPGMEEEAERWREMIEKL